MAYNNYVPQFYPTAQPQYQAQQMTQNNLTAAYVQGEAAAKSYPVAPGQFAILIDTEVPVIYTKTTDQFGRPLPLKILDYKERVPAVQLNQTNDNYVTKDELDKFKDDIKATIQESFKQNRQNNYKRPERKED